MFSQNEVSALIPILKFAENDGSSPYKFADAEDIGPIVREAFIADAMDIPEPTLPVPLPASHPANLIKELLNDCVPAIDSLVSEGTRASTTGQWRRDTVLQVSKSLRAISTMLDEGAPQRGDSAPRYACDAFLILSFAGTHTFDVGDRVFVLGLVNRSDLNGCIGEILQASQQDNAAFQKSGDGRLDVMMNSSKGKSKENVRIRPDNLRLYSRKIAHDRAVHPGIRCVIRHHSVHHDRLVVEVVSYDPRNESVVVRAVTRNPDQATFVVMVHNLVPLCLHLLARQTFVSVLKLIPELRQLDTDLGAAVVTCLKSCGLFFARCCRPDLTTDMIKLALQNYYASYIFETHALTKARKYDWYSEYSLVAVNVVTGYMEQHEHHMPAYDIHSLCKTAFEERNTTSLNVAMSYMNIGVMCCRMNRLDEAETNLLQAQKCLHERGLYETIEASKVTWGLGVCYSMQRSKWALGEKLLKDSLRMKMKRAGRASLEVTVPLDALIVLYLQQNRLKEAEILCKENFRLRESIISPYTAQYSEALFRVADLYERRGMLAECELLCKEILRLRDAFFGWESLAVAETLLLIAVLRARTMRLDEAELLLKEVLRIAPLFSRTAGSCSSGGGGIPGREVHGAAALLAHINMIRGNTDLATSLHMKALEMKLRIVDSTGQPTEANFGNLGKVWSRDSSEGGITSMVPYSGDRGVTAKSVLKESQDSEPQLDPMLTFALPEDCAPEVLAKWVVHSDLLEAKGHAKRRLYEPENAAASAWAAAANCKQEQESQEPVAEDVIDFFIDRAVQRGQLQLPPQSTATSEQESSSVSESQPEQSETAVPQSESTALPAAALNSIYQDCLSSGSGDFINLYASASDLGPVVSHLPENPESPVNVSAAASPQEGGHIGSEGGAPDQ
jgi:hypothetical protein